MPSGCDKMPNSFFAYDAISTCPPEDNRDFANGAPRNWSIKACMPTDESVSLWGKTHLRQDFTKVLYVNISVVGVNPPEIEWDRWSTWEQSTSPRTPQQESSSFRITRRGSCPALLWKKIFSRFVEMIAKPGDGLERVKLQGPLIWMQMPRMRDHNSSEYS